MTCKFLQEHTVNPTKPQHDAPIVEQPHSLHLPGPVRPPLLVHLNGQRWPKAGRHGLASFQDTTWRRGPGSCLPMSGLMGTYRRML